MQFRSLAVHHCLALCEWRVCWPQDVANISLSKRKVSEETLGSFFGGFLCYVLGTKLGGVLLLRMCHEALQVVTGGFAGREAHSYLILMKAG